MRQKRSRNGTGCVYARKKKDGTVHWWIKIHVDGRPIFRNPHTSDRDEAERQLAALLGDKANGVPVAAHQLTFGEAVANVKTAKEADGKPVNYAYDKHLLPFFKARTKMSAITTPKIREYISARKKAGASNATINRELEALSFAFTLAIRDAVLQFKPHIPMLDEHNVRKGFFEREEYEALLSHMPEHLGHVVTFGYITGWRLQEVLTLRWRNVDLQAGEVRLDPGTTKNGEGRTFPLTADLRALLEQRDAVRQRRTKKTKVVTLAKKQTEFVFTRKNGGQIQSFRKWWWRACRAAGIPDRVIVTENADGTRSTRRLPGRIFHDLRRTAVRNLVRAGVTEKVAMTLSGHKTRSVFDRYHIVSVGDLREAVQKLEAAQ